MKNKYKCLVLDHDDTCVNSTPIVHYPAFLEMLSTLRPQEKYNFEEFLLACFNPGINAFSRQILKLNDEEMQIENKIWQKYVDNNVPKFFDGIGEIISTQQENGGIVCVVTHSLKSNILRDYKANGIDLPNDVFGFELGADKCKPNPYPIETIKEKYQLNSKDILVVDDLKPGFDMAKKTNIEFACAGWSQTVEKIISFMRVNSDIYFTNVKELYDYVFIK